MQITNLEPRSSLENHARLYRQFQQLQRLLDELRRRELTDPVVLLINSEIEKVNSLPDSGTAWRRQIKRAQTNILRVVEKRMTLVPRHHYRNTWLAIGMAAFGIPLGVAFSSSIDNLSFIGVGLPVGMAIGIAIGTGLDKKARQQGRQLDFEVKH